MWTARPRLLCPDDDILTSYSGCLALCVCVCALSISFSHSAHGLQRPSPSPPRRRGSASIRALVHGTRSKRRVRFSALLRSLPLFFFPLSLFLSFLVCPLSLLSLSFSLFLTHVHSLTLSFFLYLFLSLSRSFSRARSLTQRNTPRFARTFLRFSSYTFLFNVSIFLFCSFVFRLVVSTFKRVVH